MIPVHRSVLEIEIKILPWLRVYLQNREYTVCKMWTVWGNLIVHCHGEYHSNTYLYDWSVSLHQLYCWKRFIFTEACSVLFESKHDMSGKVSVETGRKPSKIETVCGVMEGTIAHKFLTI